MEHLNLSNADEAAKFARSTAILRAIKILDGLGAKYLIKVDEVNYGTLVEAAPAPTPARKPRQVKNNFRHTGYIEKIKEMPVGGSLILECPPELVKDFRGACSGMLTKIHGAGNGMTQTLPNGVCVVRVE